MAIPFLNHLDLNQNELRNSSLHNTESTDITTPVSGQIIFDNGSGVNKLKYYDGSAWISLGGDTVRTVAVDTNGDGSVNNTLLASESLVLKKGSNITLSESAGVITISSTDNNTEYTADVGLTLTGTQFSVNVEDSQTTQASEAISTTVNRLYKVETDDEDKLVVNVPWSDTNTNTDTLQTIAADTANADRFITSVASATGAQTGLSHSTLKYNPSTETLKVTNLIVSGTSTTIDTETISLSDNIITLNSNATGAPTEDAGLEVERGDSANVSLVWDEGTDRWTFTNDGTTFYNIPISTEYDNFNFNVQVGGTSQEVSDGGTLTFATGQVDSTDGLTVAIGADDTITYKHADTSSQASVDNSGRTYIQDITLDTYGHITGITSATETVTNTNTQLATKEADIDVSNSTFISNLRATINHALDSENVVVQMYDKVTGQVVHADVEHTSNGSTISKNHVRIEFGVVPANDIRVIMIDAKDAASSVAPSYS
jgi:hypothetical protein